MRQCGSAMRSGAPAVTPSGPAQAGNARLRFQHYHTAALPHYRIATLSNCLIFVTCYEEDRTGNSGTFS